MDYPRLISLAWRMAWGHRFLWVLALFAGGAGPAFFGGGNGGQMQWETNAEEIARVAPEAGRLAVEASGWLAANQGIVVGAVITSLAIAALLVIVSLICEGAVSTATTDLARGESTTFGAAWKAGVRLFTRYLGLWVTVIAAAAGIAAIFAALAVVAFAPPIIAGPSGPNLVLAGLMIALAVPLTIIALLGSVAASIVVVFAQRAIAAEDVGPFQALRIGWGTFRSHLGESLIAWLICVGLTIGVQGVAATIIAVSATVLAGIGVGIWALAGLAVTTVGYAAVALLGLVALGLTLAALGSAFLWSYWTLAYLHLTGAIAVLEQARQSRVPQLGQLPTA